MNNERFKNVLRLCGSLTKYLGQDSDTPLLAAKILVSENPEAILQVSMVIADDVQLALESVKVYAESIPKKYGESSSILSCSNKDLCSIIYFLLSGKFKYFGGDFRSLVSLRDTLNFLRSKVLSDKAQSNFITLTNKLKDQIVELVKFSLEHPEAFDTLPSEFEDLFEYSSMLETIWYYQDELKEENPELGFKEKLERFVEEHEKA